MIPFAVLLSVALWAGAAQADEPLSKPGDNRLRIQRGVAYASQPFLSAKGGRPPYSFAVDAAALPPGIMVAAGGTLSGITCGSDGIFLLGKVSVGDAAGAAASDAAPMLTVDPAPPGGCALALGATLTRAVAGQPYKALLSARGGAAPYRFSVAAGALPAGLALAPNGTLSGSPLTAGRHPVTLAVRDAAGATGAISATLHVVSVSVAPAGLAPGTVGTAYAQSLSAAGGTEPYSYAVTAGVLPAGLSLSRSGKLGGTPTASGSARFSVAVTDAGGAVVTRGYTLRIQSAGTAARAALSGVTAAAALAPEQPVRRSVIQAEGDTPSPPVATGERPDASTDPVVVGLRAAEAEALERLGAAQVRNVLARLDGDTDCGPGWRQQLRLNADWRDARPAWAAGEDVAGPGLTPGPSGCSSGASVWAAGTLDYGRAAGVSAVDGNRFSTPGLSAGIDLAPLRGLRSGIAFGHAQDHSAVGGGAGRVDSRSESITAYGSWQAPLGVRLDVALGQARTLLDLQRTVTGDAGALQGQRRVTQRFGALAGSTRIDLGPWRVVPRLGVEHKRAAANAYAENEASPLALGYDATQLASSDLRGGLALSRQWRPALWTVEPQLSVDWQRRLQGNTTQALRYADDATGTSYTLSSAEPAAESAQLGLGVRLAHPQGWSLSLGARSMLDGGALRSAGYSAAMRWPF